jgi:hypothetical protein
MASVCEKCGICANFQPYRDETVPKLCRGEFGLMLGELTPETPCMNPGQFRLLKKSDTIFLSSSAPHTETVSGHPKT